MTLATDPALIALQTATLALIARYEWMTAQKVKVAA